MDSSLPLLRGTLDVMILKALSLGEVHGYGISRWIRDQTGGVFEVQEGALYPALRRLAATRAAAPVGPAQSAGSRPPAGHAPRRPALRFGGRENSVL